MNGATAGIVVVALGLGTAEARAETPEELFDRGNTAYEAGRFGEAVEAYRGALRYGIRDARLEYNLANAEFKQGRLGRAILHYQRALRLDPTEEDARRNLELVESYRVDRVEPAELAGVVRWVRELQERLGPDRHAIAVLVLVWAISALVAWCSSRPGGWNAAAGWLVATLVAVLVLAAVSWRLTYQRLEGQALAVVLDEAVQVLAGPGENNATLFTVHEGLTVEVRADRGGWLQVSLPNGLNGWLRREAVERV